MGLTMAHTTEERFRPGRVRMVPRAGAAVAASPTPGRESHTTPPSGAHLRSALAARRDTSTLRCMSRAGDEPQSPYLLAPGPERRALMRKHGIVVCLLDYDDEEWAAMQEARTTAETPRQASTDNTDPAARLA